MIVLVDQDGVLADFEQAFFQVWSAAGHPWPAIPPAARRSFYVRDDYPLAARPQVEAIYTAPGFYRGLPPVAGAVAALQRMLALGIDVRICTSPLGAYRHCVLEKYEWVDEHLGPDFVARMVVTKDKTIVRGDVLIDDKPTIEGACVPEWTHLVFDQPYNREATARRIDWNTWEAVLRPDGSAGGAPGIGAGRT